jgi:hypothetical protein
MPRERQKIYSVRILYKNGKSLTLGFYASKEIMMECANRALADLGETTESVKVEIVTDWLIGNEI